jgi:methylated-DNA-[protein]-cysteine S-methyltransferase
MEQENLHYRQYTSPLGDLYLIFKDQFLTGLEFKKPHLKTDSIPDEFEKELNAFFNGELKEFSQSIKLLSGTEFEQKVWLALRKIPYGETRSYKWLAETVGSPKGNRAVGRALSKNPVPIVLPCHRIIESTGKLGGYTPGLDIKRRLLSLEYYCK